MTLVERALKRGKLLKPTAFLPNGCGPGAALVDLVPDELGGVEFGDVCDLHDLAYYEGGFTGLFWRRPKADFNLAAGMARRFGRAAKARWQRGEKLKAAGTAALSAVAPPLYFLAVFALGWTPLTWRWKRRPLPTKRRLRFVERKLNDGL